MIILIGSGTGHLFIAKDGKGWQRVPADNGEGFGNPPNITLCDCCMNQRATPNVHRKFKELGVSYENDGTNPPTEEEWLEAKRQFDAGQGVRD